MKNRNFSGMGITDLQVYATAGEMSPENMTPQKQKAFLSMCDYYGLTIEREVGETPEADIRLAADYLKQLIG